MQCTKKVSARVPTYAEAAFASLKKEESQRNHLNIDGAPLENMLDKIDHEPGVLHSESTHSEGGD